MCCQPNLIQSKASIRAASLSAIRSSQVQYMFKVTFKLRVIQGKHAC